MKSTKQCPKCGERTVKVIRSRESDEGRRRTHECICSHRWTTVERAEETETASAARVALDDLIKALQAAIDRVRALRDERFSA